MEYQVQVTDELGVVINTGPGAPPLVKVELGWEANTAEELAQRTEQLAIDVRDVSGSETLLTRWGVPMTCDGEKVGSATVLLWLRDELRNPAQPPIPALVALRETRRASV